MAIKIRNAQEENGTWYYQLYGPATTTGNVQIAANQSSEEPQVWLDAHPSEAQALIDAGVGGNAFCRREELAIFLANTPIANNLATANYNGLLNAITNRTANQETIFLQLLALRARVSIAESEEM